MPPRSRCVGGGGHTIATHQRNTVERCTNHLKQGCGLAMRTEKLATAYQAAPHLAAILAAILTGTRR